MSEPWLILTTRYGKDVRSPSDDALRRALEEVANPAAATDTEHGGAFVRYGPSDNGPMYVLTYGTSRRLSFEQWADPDFEAELAPGQYMPDVSPSDALRMMLELGRGEVEAVRRQPWLPNR